LPVTSDSASSTIDDLGDTFTIDAAITDVGDDLSSITMSRPARCSHLDDSSDAGVSDVDMDDIDVTFNVSNPLTIKGRDFARFQKLAAQLGGLSLDIWTYQERFGAVTEASPFGERVWHGLSELASEYPHPNKIHGDIAWLGYFVSPELFSKSTAASPTSAVAPSRAWTSQHAYPAVFVLERRQHDCLIDTVIGPHRIGHHPSDMDFYTGIELHGKTTLTDAEKMSDPWSIAGCTIIEFDSLTFGPVQMLCLKILIAGSRPWYVHASRLRLYRPLSRL
jgi:hypothetical protein